MVQVALEDLVSDVVDALRQIAGMGSRKSCRLNCRRRHCFVRIDQAVAMGLYLAVVVPPYLDAAAGLGACCASALRWKTPNACDVVIATAKEATIVTDPLRRRLAAAYLRQLIAEVEPGSDPGATRVQIRLQSLQAARPVGRSA